MEILFNILIITSPILLFGVMSLVANPLEKKFDKIMKGKGK